MQSGGYDYEFVQTPSDTLICQICHCPSKEPHLSVCCGHTFCKSCLKAAKEVMFGANACPMCRNVQFVTFPNKQTDRIIRSLRVYCCNKKRGCKWQGEVNAMTSHLNNRGGGCQFQEVNCPNDCGVAYQRRYLMCHVNAECPRRKVNCQYCHDTGEHQFIESQHKEECPKLPLPCPNNCKVRSVPREDMEKHRRECLFEFIDCVSQCGKKLARWCLTSHVETECPRRKVNCQYCHDTGEHQFIEGQHKDECPKLPLPCPNKCEIDNIPRDGLTEHIKICPLQLMQCKYHIVGCEAIIARKDQRKHNKEIMEEHLSFSLSELAATKVLMEQTIHHLTQKLSSAEKEITDLKLQHATLTENNDKALAKAEKKFQSKVTELESKLQNLNMMAWTTYLDKEAYKLSSDNVILPVVVKISDFTEKKRRMIQWFSEPFYTLSNGYKMQLCVFPFGDAGSSKGSHMTVCLYLLKGPYDEQLQWPMKGEYEVKLLNQNSDSMHHSVTNSINYRNSDKPTAKRNEFASWHSQFFISLTALTATNCFLKDDSIYIQVCKPLH